MTRTIWNSGVFCWNSESLTETADDFVGTSVAVNAFTAAMKPLLLSLALVLSPAALAERPNIVLVLADDLGYGDLACFGSKDVQTPNLDRFASEGLRFTSCYAGHGNCSPFAHGVDDGTHADARGCAGLDPGRLSGACAGAARSRSPGCCSNPGMRRVMWANGT
jgi:hypothetical protein